MAYTRITLPYKIKREVLALGAQSKSSFSFAGKNFLYLSEPDGDLSELENFNLFGKNLAVFQKKLRIKPKLIACDLHPEYISSKYAHDLARDRKIAIKTVQHHTAHVASCMVDNKLKKRVIGVAFDGTGFGLDGNIWGGEFFIGDIKGFRRLAHLKYIQMPGGEASIREPWRMALGYLYSVYGKNLKNLKIGFMPNINKEKLDLVLQAMDKNINTPLTSSIGRLFDAVSSMLGLCNTAKYEAQGAIELEKRIVESLTPYHKGTGHEFKAKSYNFDIIKDKDIFVIAPDEVIKSIIKDVKNKVPNSDISLKFHNAVSFMIKNTCNLLRKKYKINKVCLSGGVFQNKYLIKTTMPLLERDDFEVYFHRNIPTHDGGISAGQAILAGS